MSTEKINTEKINTENTNNNMTDHIEDMNVEIDYDKLARAIVKAQIEADNAIKKLEEKKRSEILELRKDYLQEKDYSGERNFITRGLKTFFNRLRVFIKLLFIPKEELEFFSAIDRLTALFTSALLSIIKFILYVLTIIFTIGLLYGAHIMPLLPFALVCFVFARFFRIIQYEIDRMNKRDYFFALLIGIIWVIIVIALLTA